MVKIIYFTEALSVRKKMKGSTSSQGISYHEVCLPFQGEGGGGGGGGGGGLLKKAKLSSLEFIFPFGKPLSSRKHIGRHKSCATL